MNSVIRYSSRGPAPAARLAAVTGNGVIPAPVRPRSGIDRHATSPAGTFALQCAASMDTYPPASTNPRRHGNGTEGFRTTASTSTDRSAPDTVIGTVVAPFGARLQSIRTVIRSSSSTRPPRGSTSTHGAPVETVHRNGVRPRLNTSMYWAGALWNGLNSGSAGRPAAPGHASTDPSTATPREAAEGSESRFTAGKSTSGNATLFSSGCCQGAFGP